MIERVFHPYQNWEDYQSGMYDELKEGREMRVILAIRLLASPPLCEHFMREIVKRWKVSTEQVLTNASCNRRAWLGQAACCLYAGVREDETREAWGLLKDEERNKANEIAEKVIADYERLRSDNKTDCDLFS